VSEVVEELKRNELIQVQPGESQEEAKARLFADLEEHDRLNACLAETYSFDDRGDGKVYGWADILPAKAPVRVAFMFLVVDRLKQESWWREWFEQADAAGHGQHYSIVYHRGSAYGKAEDEITDLLKEKGVAVSPATKTGWARNGLVRAELLLLRHALEEAENQWFVLLSDTCMPVYAFSDLYQILTGQTLSRFRDFGMTLDIAMQRNIWQPGVCCNARFSHKADQWATWVREDAEWFVRENHLMKLKPMATFVDEQYFINMMDEHGRPYDDASTTYTRWWKLSRTRVQREGIKKFASSPHTFQTVDMARIRRARRRDCLFLRKVGAGAAYPRVEELNLNPRALDTVKDALAKSLAQLHVWAGSACEYFLRLVVLLLSVITFGWIGEERTRRSTLKKDN